MQGEDLEALLVEVCDKPFLKLVNVAPTRQENQDRASRLLLLSLFQSLLLGLVHPVNVQDKSLDDRIIEGKAALLKNVVLAQAINQSSLAHRSHHLVLQALIPEAPQYLSVLRLDVPEHNGLPSTLVPIALRTRRDVDAATQDARPEPLPEHRLLVEGSRDLVHVKLADWKHAPWDVDLGCTLKVPLKGFHLQCGAHQDDSQVAPSLEEVPNEDHIEICQLITLVDLVKDHVCDAVQLRVMKHALPKDTEGCKHQSGIWVSRSKWNLVANVLAQRLAPLNSDAFCQRRRRKLPRLHDEDPCSWASIKDQLWDLRGLATASLADQQANLTAANFLDDVLPLLEDWELLTLLLDLRVCRICSPLLLRRFHVIDRHRHPAGGIRAVCPANIVLGHVTLRAVSRPRDPVGTIFIDVL
mmetsp:Transcript_82788/g.208438  ORF Transcript_82788/g.208438 Transcript_82788/m.208438 type:complete len:413 (-) Transcript_82788:545-1783(-)